MINKLIDATTTMKCETYEEAENLFKQEKYEES